MFFTPPLQLCCLVVFDCWVIQQSSDCINQDQHWLILCSSLYLIVSNFSKQQIQIKANSTYLCIAIHGHRWIVLRTEKTSMRQFGRQICRTSETSWLWYLVKLMREELSCFRICIDFDSVNALSRPCLINFHHQTSHFETSSFPAGPPWCWCFWMY